MFTYRYICKDLPFVLIGLIGALGGTAGAFPFVLFLTGFSPSALLPFLGVAASPPLAPEFF